jgi:translocator protein
MTKTVKPFKTWTDFLLLFLPMIVGYSCSMGCSIGKNTGSNVKFRPPAWFFGVIWPILFILLGISWIYSVRENKWNYLVYSLLISMLGLWIIIYGCVKSKKGGVWILVFTICIAIIAMCTGNLSSRLCLAPLLAWAFFATLMNTSEVQESK